MNMKTLTQDMKMKEPLLASSPVSKRNQALQNILDALPQHKEEIFQANAEDIAEAKENGVAPAIQKRLVFNEDKLSSLLDGLRQLIALPDPLGKTTLRRQLDKGLILRRVTCPIGVIGVIFEARPDALVQISSLCLKSGNSAILKGGSETKHTNRALFRLIHDAAVKAGLPETSLALAEAHQEIDELLTCNHTVDLLVPRGSAKFIRYIMTHTQIPVLGHADGVCHIYVDREYDPKLAIPVIVDSKVQYPAACNAVETVLIHRDIAKDFLPPLADALKKAGVKLRGTEEVNAVTPVEVMAPEESWHHEYLDLVLALKIVGSMEEAVDHINRYGSHHTESILTTNEKTAEYFMNHVDSADVYHNVSTRFADGFRYGFGAELGISTGKIHARGPVGLEGLVTYQYRLEGNGQIVGDYASGKKSFHFKDL